MKKILISDKERTKILGLHKNEKVSKNYFGRVAEQVEQQLNSNNDELEEQDEAPVSDEELTDPDMEVLEGEDCEEDDEFC